MSRPAPPLGLSPTLFVVVPSGHIVLRWDGESWSGEGRIVRTDGVAGRDPLGQWAVATAE